MLCMGLSMFLFVFIDKVDNYYAYVTLLFLTRFIQGFSSSAIQTTWYTVSGKIYKDHQSIVISMLEMSCGVGLTLGPVLGSILFNIGGYAMPFIFFGTIFVAFGCILNRIIPASLDRKNSNDDTLLMNESFENQPSEVFITDLIKKPTILLACGAGLMSYFNYSMREPILAVHFKDHYGLDTIESGLLFSLVPLFYVSGGIISYI